MGLATVDPHIVIKCIPKFYKIFKFGVNRVNRPNSKQDTVI